MEHTALDLWRDRFFGFLQSAPIDQFMVMLWAVDALQSGRAAAAAKFITFPKDAETTDAFSPSYAHRWRLETIANEAIIHCRSRSPLLYGNSIDCRNFYTFVTANNALHGLALHKGNLSGR